MHIPVLVQEVIDGLKLNPGRQIIDCTLGDGGHSQEILKTDALLQQNAPGYKKYFRFPGLCADAFDIATVQQLGYRIIGGDVTGGIVTVLAVKISKRIESHLGPQRQEDLAQQVRLKSDSL